ncbi:MAG: hypothetical protein LC800_19290 [Acidobacteria bacterium]|nr:hypothetical protein [Acidobacteriota bacterium]
MNVKVLVASPEVSDKVSSRFARQRIPSRLLQLLCQWEIALKIGRRERETQVFRGLDRAKNSIAPAARVYLLRSAGLTAPRGGFLTAKTKGKNEACEAGIKCESRSHSNRWIPAKF